MRCGWLGRSPEGRALTTRGPSRRSPRRWIGRSRDSRGDDGECRRRPAEMGRECDGRGGSSALPGPPPPPPCRRCLQLPGRTGLDVVPTLTKLLEQSRLLHFALEEFEGVLQAIALIEPNFYHAAS